jgi:hypothetical protein
MKIESRPTALGSRCRSHVTKRKAKDGWTEKKARAVGGHRVLRVKNSFMESPFLLPNSVLTLCGLSKNYSQDIKRQVIEVIDGRRQAQT